MQVVVDANISLALAVPLPYSEAATVLFRAWIEEGAELLTPTLWDYEVVSALRKAEVLGVLSEDEASEALAKLLKLEIRRVRPTETLARAGLYWARRLGQTVAYDAAYLALAEQEGAELWTTDQKLSRTSKRIGLEWVRGVAATTETSEPEP